MSTEQTSDEEHVADFMKYLGFNWNHDLKVWTHHDLEEWALLQRARHALPQ